MLFRGPPWGAVVFYGRCPTPAAGAVDTVQ